MTTEAELVAAFSTSLFNDAHGWQASAYIRNNRQEMATGQNENGDTVLVAIDVEEVTVNLRALAMRFPIGSRTALQATYMAKLDESGALQAAKLFLFAAQYDVNNSALHDKIMALAESWLESHASSLSAALQADPVITA